MYEATNLLSSSSNPSQGDIRLAFIGMFAKLNQYRRGSHLQKQIASAIYEKLLKYWKKHLDQSSIISSLLDPRYKCSAFKDDKVQDAIKILQEMFLSYIPSNAQQIPKTKTTSRDYFLNILNNNNNIYNSNDSNEELNRYFNSPCDSHTDPLTWWKLHSKDYPILSYMAKDYLSIQATSVAS